jgi:ubiquinone/menaquinone biosynthesis C-methylase UbiE
MGTDQLPTAVALPGSKSSLGPRRTARVGGRPVTASSPADSPGLLGDTTSRDYAAKLQLFSAFAEPELRQAIASLNLTPGMRIVDVGCGTGEAIRWLSEHVRPGGAVVGFDLAAAHVSAARRATMADTLILQGDLLHAPFAAASFDLVWCANTIHHLRDPLTGLGALARLLRPGGRIACGQSALLPDLLFAWDSRLERLTHEAVRHYYRDRYGIEERELTNVRSILGLMRRAGLENVRVSTLLIERVSPLEPAAERYLNEAIFRGTWGARLRQYLSPADYAELERLCDPQGDGFALRRPDFHYLQSFTLAVGETVGHPPA